MKCAQNGGSMCGHCESVLEQFGIAPGTCSVRIFGSGHINRTYLVSQENGEKLILQRINRSVFQKPEEVMENVVGVTRFLQEKIREAGGDPWRETLHVMETVQGDPYFRDVQGKYWRIYRYIEGASCYDLVEKPSDFYESAVAFGHFQNLLADYPAESLHETLPGFHDTRARVQKFKEALEADACQRKRLVQKEIDFVLAREDLADVFGDLQKRGELPLRVTHNDAKLNNIMIDDATGKAICVIDLDTVMPGLAMNDFGDSIRFGASTALEDETDLAKVSCDMELFEAYVKGFLEGCDGKLTDLEISLLPMGAKIMTYECGVRFLTDYLEGDHYFHIEREHQNLDRARTQFKLIEDMEQKWKVMQDIVKKYQNYKQNHQ